MPTCSRTALSPGPGPALRRLPSNCLSPRPALRRSPSIADDSVVAFGIAAGPAVTGQVLQERDHDFAGGVERLAGLAHGERLGQGPQDTVGVLDGGREEHDV